MTRVAGVILCALLTAAISGVNDAALVRAEQTAEAQQEEIVARLQRIPLNSVVRIERTDGTTLNALLQDVTPDAVVVRLLEGQNGGQATIQINDIRRIDRVQGRALRKVLIGVGVGAAVLVGVCAVALRQSEDAHTGTRRDGEAQP